MGERKIAVPLEGQGERRQAGDPDGDGEVRPVARATPKREAAGAPQAATRAEASISTTPDGPAVDQAEAFRRRLNDIEHTAWLARRYSSLRIVWLERVRALVTVIGPVAAYAGGMLGKASVWGVALGGLALVLNTTLFKGISDTISHWRERGRLWQLLYAKTRNIFDDEWDLLIPLDLEVEQLWATERPHMGWVSAQAHNDYLDHISAAASPRYRISWWRRWTGQLFGTAPLTPKQHATGSRLLRR